MAISKKQREALKQKYGGHCAYCGCILGDKWHADHIEPVDRQWWKPGAPASKPENDVIENMNPACPPCNIDKHSLTLENWRAMMQQTCKALMRDSSTFRRAVRYGLVKIDDSPIVFYFERIADAKKQ